jgi:hypothetical protein
VGDGLVTLAFAAVLALAAALIAAGVALKRADDRAAAFVDDSHIPMHQEDQ